MNIVEPVLHFGKTQAGAQALVEHERTTTYGELAVGVRRMADHFVGLGFAPGDRIGVRLKDTSDHIIALLGAAYIGAVATPLDWRAKDGEIARLCAELGLAAILDEPDAPRLEKVPAVVLDDRWRSAASGARVNAGPAEGGTNPFVISATSGSTGRPKFTVMSHHQYYFAIIGMLELMGLAGRHRFLCTMPLYYSGGRNSLMAHLLRGDCVELYPSLFSPAEYVELIRRKRITVAGGVPTMVRQLLNAPGETPRLPGLALLFSTGAPLFAAEKHAAVSRLSSHFHERYGTAETMAISVLRPSDFADRPDSVGQPHSLAQIEIAGEDDQPLLTGETGRLRFRGPGLGSPLGDAAQASFRNGWYYPGELASVDEAGFIFLKGRTSDVIIRNGAKIYPAEVEAVLLGHAGVVEAAVVGVLGEDNEETVVAFVTPREGVTVGELIAHCRARLSPHKTPREFHFLEALPTNTAGKPDKQALTERLRQGREAADQG